jgi:small subunit ribosomal protein S1
MNHFFSSKYKKNKIADILLKYNYQTKIGDILAGRIVGKERKEMLVDLGLKQAAFLPNMEITIKTTQDLPIPEFNEFIIIFYNFQNSRTILSLRRLHLIRLWERFKQLDYNNMVLFTKLQRSIWGGKLVQFDGLISFIPNFHLPKYYRRRQNRNHSLPIKILEVKNWNHSIIGSSRLAVFKKYSPCLTIGVIQNCYITGVKPFGVFLNIYGFRSLLHISEISNKKVKNLNSIYRKGDQIEVKILYINNSKGKVAVSMKKARLSSTHNG